MSNNKIRKIPLFYMIFIACFSIAFVVLAVGLIVLRFYLADFEGAQPRYVADEVFEKYFSPLDAKTLAEDAECKSAPFDKTDTKADFLEKMIPQGAKVSYYNVSTGIDTDIIKYNVRYSIDNAESGADTEEKDADYVKFASFTLKKTGEKSKKGFALYALDSIEVNYPHLVSAKIKIPSGYSLTINGIVPNDEYISERDADSESCAHMPEGVNGIKHNVYTIDNLLAEPEISVKAPDGNLCTVSYDEAEKEYIALPINDIQLAQEYSEYVIKAAQTYATYMQNDTSFAKVAKYFEKGTPLYEAIRKSATIWVIDHDSYEFENVSADEFYAYDENTFSCRVRLTHVLHRSRLEDFRDNMDVTFYLRNINGTFVIYDRTNN